MRLYTFRPATDNYSQSVLDKDSELVITKFKELVDTGRKASAPGNFVLRTDHSESPPDSMPRKMSASTPRLVEIPSARPFSDPAEMSPMASDSRLRSTGREPLAEDEHIPKPIQFDGSDSEDQPLVDPLRVVSPQVDIARDPKVFSRSSSVHQNDDLATPSTISERETVDEDRPEFTNDYHIHWIRVRDCLSEFAHNCITAMFDLSLDVVNSLGPEIVPLITGHVRLLWLCVS